ncbi:putative leader peptide [Streptomyces chiangmaiensis]|uniref:Leader peptide n=1 Tax=Streptomyces chiangmaiensis TaxID=766497 RepID=A0ABU7F9G3_9ACTN|nr:putative leader peptide [Streptomyces chiangmaiensis]MED7820832.1 putative leader peptide [Streptomyces chiangmaiensis]
MTLAPRFGPRAVIDTRLCFWRRVHVDLVRYAGCVCCPSC